MTSPELRVADADRHQAVALLIEHCAAGRLSMAEFEERTTEAFAARTFGDLHDTLRELPPLPAPQQAPPVPAARRRRGLRRPVPVWLAGAAAVVALVVGVSTGESPTLLIDDRSPVVNEVAGPDRLPVPGARQPADAAAAELLVRGAYATVFTAGSPDEAKAAAIDRPERVDIGYRQVVGTYSAGLASLGVRTHRIVFTTPGEAFVDYQVLTGGAPWGERRIGRAVLLEGTWRVASDTICAALQDVGGSCPA